MIVLIQFDILDSGRYNPKLKNETMFRAICSDGQDIQVTGECVLAYRNDNKKNIEMRTLADVNIIKYLILV